MRRLFLATSFIVLAFISSQTTARAADPSTGGISLSMYPEDVRQKLGDTYTLSQTVNITRGKVFNFIKGNEAFNLMTLGPKIVYIEHQQVFDPGGEIVASDLKKALEAKYGKPSPVKNTAGEIVETWVTGKDGKPVMDASQAQACADFELEGPAMKRLDKITYDFSFPRIPVKDNMGSCSTVVVAKPALSNENPGLVTHLTVIVFDVGEANHWFGEAMTAYNKHLEDEVEAARKNKPNL